MIQGERKPDFARKVGISVGRVVAINPTAEQIQKLFELEEPLEKEPEYVTEKDKDVPDHIGEDGQVIKVTRTVKTCRIDIYVQDVAENNITKRSFFLEGRAFVKKDLTKQQYLNCLGKTAWVDTPANLPQKFTHRLDKTGSPIETVEYHPSIVGESDLIEFLDNWLSINKSKRYDLSITTDSLFKGDYRELQSLVNSELASQFAFVYTVRAVEGESGVQFYQDVWKRILPAFTYKFFSEGYFTPEKLRELKEKEALIKDKITRKVQIQNNEWLSNWEKFALEITDDNGCKDFYSLDPAKNFDPNTHYAMQAATIEPTSNEY